MVGVDQVIDEVVVDPPYGSGTFILVVDEKSDYDEQFARYFSIVHETTDVCFSDLKEGTLFLMKYSISDES